VSVYVTYTECGYAFSLWTWNFVVSMFDVTFMLLLLKVATWQLWPCYSGTAGKDQQKKVTATQGAKSSGFFIGQTSVLGSCENARQFSNSNLSPHSCCARGILALSGKLSILCSNFRDLWSL
jgi:hypothetical protein